MFKHGYQPILYLCLTQVVLNFEQKIENPIQAVLCDGINKWMYINVPQPSCLGKIVYLIINHFLLFKPTFVNMLRTWPDFSIQLHIANQWSDSLILTKIFEQ